MTKKNGLSCVRLLFYPHPKPMIVHYGLFMQIRVDENILMCMMRLLKMEVSVNTQLCVYSFDFVTCGKLANSASHVCLVFIMHVFSDTNLALSHGKKTLRYKNKTHCSIHFFVWDSLLLDFPILATCSLVVAMELDHWANLTSTVLKGGSHRTHRKRKGELG